MQKRVMFHTQPWGRYWRRGLVIMGTVVFVLTGSQIVLASYPDLVVHHLTFPSPFKDNRDQTSKVLTVFNTTKNPGNGGNGGQGGSGGQNNQ